MTASRAPAEPEVRQFTTTVDRIDGTDVVLEETYFYAESGGQPADRGSLGGIEVRDVQERADEVRHTLSEEPAFAPGDEVVGRIDPAFREYCMRAHTASHVLYGAARRVCDELGYAGFDIDSEKVRVDLTTAEPIDDGDLVELERLSNRAVWDGLAVTWETMTAAEARALDDIAFNERTEEGAMAGDGSGTGADRPDANDDDGDDGGVRVVTVEGWDVAACGGTHVSETTEIGPIEVLGRSNPGEGRTRVEFAVGPTGIDRDATVHAAALEASAAVDSSVEELPDAVARLAAERDELEVELRDLRAELLEGRIADLPTHEYEGATWAAGVVDGAGPNDVREPLTAAVGEAESEPDVAVVAGVDGATFLAVASTATGAVPEAGDVVELVTDEFGGGGGGAPTFAQGGGLDAEPERVVEWVRDR